MTNYIKKDFDFEEDFILECECEDCGTKYNEEVTECTECEGDNLINTTSHEGCTCVICDFTFDMWDNCYVNSKNDILICKDCYEELPDKHK